MHTLTQTHYSAIAFAAADKAAGAPAPEGEANIPLAVYTDEAIVESVSKAMRSRQTFPTVAEAVKKLSDAIAATQPKNADGTPNDEAPALFGLPIRIKGADSEGNIDESIYEGMRAALAYVGARIDDPAKKGQKITGIKAVVIFPVPTVEAFAESEKGRAWLDKIVEKEAAHVFFRGLRDAATTIDLTNGMTQGPATVDEYVTEYSRSGGLDTDTFDALWTSLRKAMVAKMPPLAKLLPAKGEVLNSIRSKAFALANFPDLETHPQAGSIFERIGLALIDAAKKNTTNGNANPLPTDAVESWLAGRDELVIAPKSEVKDYSVLANMAIDF